MLKVNDFKVGDECFILSESHGKTKEPKIIKAIVKKVGRKYITLNDAWKAQFCEDDTDYLVEKVSCGWARYLFKTEQDINDFLEYQDLTLWFANFSTYSAKKCSLEQLRKAKEILTN